MPTSLLPFILCCFRATALLLAFFLLPPTAQAREKLTIGLIPELNVFAQMQRYQPLAAALSRELDMEVELTMMSRYGNIIDRLRNQQLDAAFLGSLTAALAIVQLDIEPLARPVVQDGSGTNRGQLFVRKDSGIRTAADLRGKVMAFVDPASTAGYLFPLAWLKENGADDYRTLFKEYFFAGSHDAAIDAVLKKQADIGATKDIVLNYYLDQNPGAREQLVVLASSPPVPTNALCIMRRVSKETRAKIKACLLALDATQAGREVLKPLRATRFAAATADDYRPVMDMAREAGIDLVNMKNYSAEDH